MTHPKRGSNGTGSRGRGLHTPVRASSRLRGEPPTAAVQSVVEKARPAEQTPLNNPKAIQTGDPQCSEGIGEQPEPAHSPDNESQSHDESPKEDSKDTFRCDDNESDYPNFSYDPDPLPKSATEAQKEAYLCRINTMGEETLATYTEIRLEGEELWIEFISVFRPHSIKLWNHLLLVKWTKFLLANGVHVETGRSMDKAQKLIDLLFRDVHIATQDECHGGMPPIHMKPDVRIVKVNVVQ